MTYTKLTKIILANLLIICFLAANIPSSVFADENEAIDYRESIFSHDILDEYLPGYREYPRIPRPEGAPMSETEK